MPHDRPPFRGARARDRNARTGARHDPDQLPAGLNLIDLHRDQLRQQDLNLDVTQHPACTETGATSPATSGPNHQLRKSCKSRKPDTPDLDVVAGTSEATASPRLGCGLRLPVLGA